MPVWLRKKSVKNKNHDNNFHQNTRNNVMIIMVNIYFVTELEQIFIIKKFHNKNLWKIHKCERLSVQTANYV